MTHQKKEWYVPLMIILVFTFFFPGFMSADPGYKIISNKGTVKIKQNAKVFRLKEQSTIDLQKGDAIMVYPGAEIEVLFPGGDKKTFTGPFYAAVESLEKPPAKERLSFFAGAASWKGIERIFDEEGEESAQGSCGGFRWRGQQQPLHGKRNQERGARG